MGIALIISYPSLLPSYIIFLPQSPISIFIFCCQNLSVKKISKKNRSNFLFIFLQFQDSQLYMAIIWDWRIKCLKYFNYLIWHPYYAATFYIFLNFPTYENERQKAFVLLYLFVFQKTIKYINPNIVGYKRLGPLVN